MASPRIHPSAVIDDRVLLGEDVCIWHFCHVMSDVQMGEGCMLGQNVCIHSGVSMGRNVRIQNNVSVFRGVELQDDVFVGPSAVFTNVLRPRSFRHVAPDQYEKTMVERGASIGANATVVCGIRIGQYALIGAGSVVTADVPAFALVYGNPARQSGWVCMCGETLLVPAEASASSCAACAQAFTWADGRPHLQVAS